MTEPGTDSKRRGPLSGVRVLDCSHQYAGAFASGILRDMGAEVIAIEHPKGSPIRTMLPKRGKDSLWWLVLQREKRNVTLDLSKPEGRALFLRLAATADVVVENFRPGTMEKWKLGPRDLEAEGIRLVMLRISGYGQTGSLRDRPGFGTAAEALSGFAHLNGFPDTPPALPSITLADGVAGVFGLIGALSTLVDYRSNPGRKGVTVVDSGLVDGLFKLIPNQVTAYDQLGIEMRRYGNSLLDKGVLRDLFVTADGRYVALGGGIGPTAIHRTVSAIEAHDLAEQVKNGILKEDHETVTAFFREAHARASKWIASKNFDEATAILNRAGVVFAPIYSVKEIVADPYFEERKNIITMKDDAGTPIKVSGIVPKVEGADVPTDRAGSAMGAFNAEVFCGELGLDAAELARLKSAGVV